MQFILYFSMVLFFIFVIYIILEDKGDYWDDY